MAELNQKAVELFKEHLPAHLAESCIKQHEISIVYADSYFVHEPKDLGDALFNNLLWTEKEGAKSIHRVLFECTVGNTCDLKKFYSLCPEEARPTNDPESSDIPASDAPTNAWADLRAMAQAEDTRDPLESTPTITDILNSFEKHIEEARVKQEQKEKVDDDILNSLWCEYLMETIDKAPIWNDLKIRKEDGGLRAYTFEEFKKHRGPLVTLWSFKRRAYERQVREDVTQLIVQTELGRHQQAIQSVVQTLRNNLNADITLRLNEIQHAKRREYRPLIAIIITCTAIIVGTIIAAATLL